MRINMRPGQNIDSDGGGEGLRGGVNEERDQEDSSTEQSQTKRENQTQEKGQASTVYTI
jgi:hypothetical protein